MSQEWDFSEFDQFARDLENSVSRFGQEVRATTERGALNIKNQLVREMRSSTHFKGVAGGINYEIDSGADWVEAQIGPVKGRPGSLANIAYFGSSRGGGTVPDPIEALKAEDANFQRYFSEAVGRLLQ